MPRWPFRVLPPVDLLPYTGGGVYVLLSPAEILYVGQAKQLRQRIMDHLRTKDSITSVYFILVEDLKEREDFEEYLIKTFRPVLNRKGLRCRLVVVT